MSLPVLTPDDFLSGYYRIMTDSYTSEELEKYIEVCERESICKLLSEGVYRELRDADPLPAKYYDLLNGCDFKFNGEQRINRGFAEVLKSQIYTKWFSDNWSLRKTGKAREVNDNSDLIGTAESKQSAYTRQNTGAEIQCRDITDFINANKVRETSVLSSTEGTGVYNLACEDVKYLENGQIAEIDKVPYTAFNVDTENNTFDVADIAGLDFTGQTVTYTVFDFEPKKLDYLWL